MKNVLRTTTAVLVAWLLACTAYTASAAPAAGVASAAEVPRADLSPAEFEAKVNLDPMRPLTVQHQNTLKTFDTFSRQIITNITGTSRFEGHDPMFLLMDICLRPELYRDKPLIKIRHVPLRKDIALVEGLARDEADRIVHTGLISHDFWFSMPVQDKMRQLQATAMHKADAIARVDGAARAVGQFAGREPSFINVPMVPPPTEGEHADTWLTALEARNNAPWFRAFLTQQGAPLPPTWPGLDDKAVHDLTGAIVLMIDAWTRADADEVNELVEQVAATAPLVRPEAYPSAFKRNAEVTYNRLTKLTMPTAGVYFIAFVMFIMGSRSGWAGLRVWALRLLVVALIAHTGAIGIRWWLVEKSTDSWFYAIPIKNQFESVLFSAWFAGVVGLVLELRRGRGFFGAGACFVGWLSLVAIFGAPYVFGRDIGGEIGQAAGILMSYWLYIHVTTVVASYGLIGMGFLLSIWWLVVYHRQGGQAGLKLTNPRAVSADAARDEGLGGVNVAGAGPAGGAGAVSFGANLARVLFLPVRQQGGEAATVRTAAPTAGADFTADFARSEATAVAEERSFLARLDQCNLVVLQLAFWVLGVGIVFGAIWADMSWGRPWGWDPKETFALITWIVYLVVVHVRIATVHKAWWTAVLSIIGFGVMLFNWIGVNFFLVGLHSYA
ncbi:MAG: cytochrome c biogenesis protein CcsA [Phycisphaerae bacterium]